MEQDRKEDMEIAVTMSYFHLVMKLWLEVENAKISRLCAYVNIFLCNKRFTPPGKASHFLFKNSIVCYFKWRNFSEFRPFSRKFNSQKMKKCCIRESLS